MAAALVRGARIVEFRFELGAQFFDGFGETAHGPTKAAESGFDCVVSIIWRRAHFPRPFSKDETTIPMAAASPPECSGA